MLVQRRPSVSVQCAQVASGMTGLGFYPNDALRTLHEYAVQRTYVQASKIRTTVHINVVQGTEV